MLLGPRKGVSRQERQDGTVNKPDPGLEIVIVGVGNPASVTIAPQPQPVGSPSLTPLFRKITHSHFLYLFWGLIGDNTNGKLSNHLQKARESDANTKFRQD